MEEKLIDSLQHNEGKMDLQTYISENIGKTLKWNETDCTNFVQNFYKNFPIRDKFKNKYSSHQELQQIAKKNGFKDITDLIKQELKSLGFKSTTNPTQGDIVIWQFDKVKGLGLYFRDNYAVAPGEIAKDSDELGIAFVPMRNIKEILQWNSQESHN